MDKLIKYRRIIALIIVFFGILLGIFIFKKISNNNMNYIIENTDKIKYVNGKIIAIHIIILSISFLFSFIIIGILLISIYIFFESIIIGFMGCYFVSLHNIKGLYYSAVYLVIFKFLTIFLFLILLFKYIKIQKSIYLYLKKQSINITKTILNTIIIIFLIIINDFFLLLFGDNIINIFSFLLK